MLQTSRTHNDVNKLHYKTCGLNTWPCRKKEKDIRKIIMDNKNKKKQKKTTYNQLSIAC